jgi:signal transduction histidine kinase
MQNALDAMEGKGERKLILRTNVLSLNEADLSRMVPSAYSFIVKPGKYVRLEVEDSGQGIKEGDLPHIFELNFSTKSKDATTRGLGLALSLKFVQDALGFIEVESQIGKGTTFKVYLPLFPEEASSNTP